MTPFEKAQRAWSEAKQQHEAAREHYIRARVKLIEAYLADKYPHSPLAVKSDGYSFTIISVPHSSLDGGYDVVAIRQEIFEYLLKLETVEV